MNKSFFNYIKDFKIMYEQQQSTVSLEEINMFEHKLNSLCNFFYKENPTNRISIGNVIPETFIEDFPDIETEDLNSNDFDIRGFMLIYQVDGTNTLKAYVADFVILINKNLSTHAQPTRHKVLNFIERVLKGDFSDISFFVYPDTILDYSDDIQNSKITLCRLHNKAITLFVNDHVIVPIKQSKIFNPFQFPELTLADENTLIKTLITTPLFKIDWRICNAT